MYNSIKGELTVDPTDCCPRGHTIRAIGLASRAIVEGNAAIDAGEQPTPSYLDLTTRALGSILSARGCANPTAHLCPPNVTSGL